MTAIVHHPNLPGVRRSVADPEPWIAAGWLTDTEPEPDTMDSTGENDGDN